jgi:hypothetical protein
MGLRVSVVAQVGLKLDYTFYPGVYVSFLAADSTDQRNTF